MDIRFFDRDINFLGEVDSYTSLFYISKWETFGEFEFHVRNFNKELIQKGNIIMIDRDGYRAGVIEHIEVDTEDTEDITIKGFSLGYWFTNRITVPTTGYAYHSFNAPVEDIMLALVKANAVDPVDTNRKIPNLVLESSKGRGIKLQFQTRYKVLDEELTKLSKISGLGWNITLDYKNKKFIFKILEGKDLSAEQNTSPPQIFSIDYDNIRKQNYLDSNIGYKNMAYVAGQGEGKDREIQPLNNTLSGFDRREIFIDARDIEEGGNLVDRGKIKLAETPQVSTFECEVEPIGYKIDWNLGDIVTTLDKKLGLIKHNRVTEVKEIWEDSCYKIEPTFGTPIPTPGEKIKQATDTPLQESVQGPPGEAGTPGDRGPQGYSINYKWDNTKLGVKREDETNYTYVDLKGQRGDIGPKGDQGIPGIKGSKGDQGIQGKSLEFNWNGTQLGIRVEGQTSYTYVELKGPRGIQGIGLNFTWNGTQLGIKREDESSYKYVDLKGHKGDTGIQGKSLEFNWNGTQLGIRVEGQTSYTYVDLKGQKGDKGIQGERGIQGLQGNTGPQGIPGKNIEFVWSGTQLGVRQQGQTTYAYVNLRGPQGLKGDIGPQGLQGVKGPRGEQGPQGLPGKDGKDGTQIISSATEPSGAQVGTVWI